MKWNIQSSDWWVELKYNVCRDGEIGIVIVQKIKEGFSKQMLTDLTSEGVKEADS